MGRGRPPPRRGEALAAGRVLSSEADEVGPHRTEDEQRVEPAQRGCGRARAREHEAGDELAEQLQRDFGSLDRFKAQFNAAANSVQGSGWALASWEPTAGRIIIEQVRDHQHNHVQGAVPLLTFDAWEHAFYLQYRNVKADFFDALWNVVNWEDVAGRLKGARS